MYCLATNAITAVDGTFRNGACRGCGRPRAACHPQEIYERELDALFQESAFVGTYAGVAAAGAAAVVVGWVVDLILGWITGPVLATAVGIVLGLVARTPAGLKAMWALRRWYWYRHASQWDPPGLGEWEWVEAERRADVQRRTKAERRAREQSSQATQHGRGVPWRLVVGAAVPLVGGYYWYQAEFGDYDQGRKAGVQHVREVSMKGAFLRAGMNAANLIDLIPTNPNASPDWNAGFRAGFQEEIARMYPAARK
ncbi:hypothetical protein [Fimbriiglobus ruber]|uniref:Uncharacterized protein n=1 Tax=Fimbriiglobus ruber TaxID=1908690 RepID=A0A225DNG8_9BACT|nr:hypothetical protein [Fimbriiglobus ruber]OWK41244.1 hypothetical protein FRUB_04607 [Fimbriiglobus ruber]